MKKFGWAIALFLAFWSITASAKHSLEDFARHAQFIDIKISPSGQYLAATMRGEEGRIELVVLDMQQDMKPISRSAFSGNNSIYDFNWANDERIVFSLSREFGSQEAAVPTGELLAMNADGTRQLPLFGPNARDRDLATARIIHWLPDDPRHILIQARPYSRNETYTTVYRLNIETARKRQVARPPVREATIITDGNGYPRLAVGADIRRDNEVVIVHRAPGSRDWQEVSRYDSDQGGFSPYIFLANDNEVLGISDRMTETRAIVIFNIETGDERLLYHNENVDVAPIFSIRNGFADEVIGAVSEYETLEYAFFDHVQDTRFRDELAGLINAFDGRRLSLRSSTRDNRLSIVSVSSESEPAEFYLFDRESKQVSYLLNTRPWINPEHIAVSQSIVYPARDGQAIHAILTLPKGQEAKDLPLILMPHGGPHGIRDALFFDPTVKMLAQHGYAVLQPNFRGSGGFGRSFQIAGYRNWGTLMIDDMTDGVLHLVEQGIVDKGRVCSFGASYGGYAAVMSAIREPDLYQCVLGYVGVYDLEMLYTTGDIPERQSGINYLERVIGRDAESLRAQSPVHHIDKLRAPVFIIHGEKDMRATIDHANVLRAALEKHQHPYEWLVEPNEGHGFYKPENNVRLWTRVLEFLDKYLNR